MSAADRRDAAPAAFHGPPFEVPVCASCERGAFPPRPLCPDCGGRDWQQRVAAGGVVELCTWRYHRIREERRLPVVQWRDLHQVPIAYVRLDLGPVVIAWSPDEAPTGSRVRLESSSAVPVALLPT